MKPGSSFSQSGLSPFWRMVVFILVVIGLVALALFVLDPARARAAQLRVLPISMRSTLSANYSADPHTFVIPQMNARLVQEVVRDRSAFSTQENGAGGSLFIDLQTPIPTVTSQAPRGTATNRPVTSTPLPTENNEATPAGHSTSQPTHQPPTVLPTAALSPTIAATVTQQPSATLPPTVTPLPTLIPTATQIPTDVPPTKLPTLTSTPLPTNTETSLPPPTSTETPIPLPTFTSTPSRTPKPSATATSAQPATIVPTPTPSSTTPPTLTPRATRTPTPILTNTRTPAFTRTATRGSVIIPTRTKTKPGTIPHMPEAGHPKIDEDNAWLDTFGNVSGWIQILFKQLLSY